MVKKKDDPSIKWFSCSQKNSKGEKIECTNDRNPHYVECRIPSKKRWIAFDARDTTFEEACARVAEIT